MYVWHTLCKLVLYAATVSLSESVMRRSAGEIVALRFVCMIGLSQSVCLETAYQHVQNDCLFHVHKLRGVLLSSVV